MNFSVVNMNKLIFILLLITSVSYESLESDLQSIPTFPYIEQVWDCSEMSFFLQHELENRGYNAQVALKTGSPGHSWVIIVAGDHIITVESTTMEIVPFRKDFDMVFRNATDAINHGIPEDEVDWWNYESF